MKRMEKLKNRMANGNFCDKNILMEVVVGWWGLIANLCPVVLLDKNVVQINLKPFNVFSRHPREFHVLIQTKNRHKKI